MGHFYLTLPSNSSMDYFPDNTLTNFTTKLHKEISLQDDWEMGLAEIIFPKKMFNVDKEQSVTVIRYARNMNPGSYTNYATKSAVKAGYYANIDELVYEVNNAMRTKKHPLHFYAKEIDEQVRKTSREMSSIIGKLDKNENITYDDDDVEAYPIFSFKQFEQKVRIELLPYSEIVLSDDLNQILGFPTGFRLHNLTNIRKFVESPVDINVESNRQTFYIYCDIMECVPVGDTLAPLLRTIDVDGMRGAMIHRNFDQPRYLPIQKKNFDTIQIDIRDGLGRPIPFVGDAVIVTVHHRRANIPYFLS